MLADTSTQAIAAAMNYAEAHNWDRLLLRHDSPTGEGRTVQGGFLVGLDDLRSWVARFVHGGVCILLEPFNAIRNGYNLSCFFDHTSALMEVVGPAFDASDLQRGQTVPHEIRSVDLQTRTFGSPAVISENAYQRSVIERERKIWWKYYRRELSTARWRDLSERETVRCRQFIREARGAPIPCKYKPIPEAMLQQYGRSLFRVTTAWREQFRHSAVLASSFVQTEELIFWDVSTHVRWIGTTERASKSMGS